MKASHIVPALLFLAIAGRAVAQQETQTQTQKAEVPTSLEVRATNAGSIQMSYAQVADITHSSAKQTLSEDLTKMTRDVLTSRLSGSYAALSAGRTISISTPIASDSRLITARHTMNVQMSYDVRPIGGILTVKVALVPVFTGIGSASRAIVYRERTEAVDSFDEAAVTSIVDELTQEISTEVSTTNEAR